MPDGPELTRAQASAHPGATTFVASPMAGTAAAHAAAERALLAQQEAHTTRVTMAEATKNLQHQHEALRAYHFGKLERNSIRRSQLERYKRAKAAKADRKGMRDLEVARYVIPGLLVKPRQRDTEARATSAALAYSDKHRAERAADDAAMEGRHMRRNDRDRASFLYRNTETPANEEDEENEEEKHHLWELARSARIKGAINRVHADAHPAPPAPDWWPRGPPTPIPAGHKAARYLVDPPRAKAAAKRQAWRRPPLDPGVDVKRQKMTGGAWWDALDPNKNGLAKAFDPNQNGVAKALDPNQNGVAKALDPNQNGVKKAFDDAGQKISHEFVDPDSVFRSQVVPALASVANYIPIPGVAAAVNAAQTANKYAGMAQYAGVIPGASPPPPEEGGEEPMQGGEEPMPGSGRYGHRMKNGRISHLQRQFDPTGKAARRALLMSEAMRRTKGMPGNRLVNAHAFIREHPEKAEKLMTSNTPSVRAALLSSAEARLDRERQKRPAHTPVGEGVSKRRAQVKAVRDAPIPADWDLRYPTSTRVHTDVWGGDKAHQRAARMAYATRYIVPRAEVKARLKAVKAASFR